MKDSRPVVGYIRESVWHRASVSARLTQQRTELEYEAAERGIEIAQIEEDQAAGRSLRRSGLQRALAECREGRAAGIVVTRLHRLTRDLDDLATLVADAREHSYAIVALDVGLDTREADAAALVRVLGQAAGWSRRALEREALPARPPAKRRRGRPFSISPELAERIRSMRAAGRTLQGICDVLNHERIPTARGGSHWRPTSLRAVLRPPTASQE